MDSSESLPILRKKVGSDYFAAKKVEFLFLYLMPVPYYFA
jgi:hypothetical protein